MIQEMDEDIMKHSGRERGKSQVIRLFLYLSFKIVYLLN
jgi:hypothetical protein